MRCAVVLIAALALTGCGLELLTTTAITGELRKQEAESATGVLQDAERRTGQWEAQQAIQAYRAEHGHNPSSLHELVPEYLAEVPKTADGEPMAYDPATGRIGEGGAQARLADIQRAIRRYADDHGRYPPSLDALAPNYLAETPRTETGQPFAYNPHTGAVAHPRQLQQQQRQWGQGPSGGMQPPQQRGAGGNVGVYGRERVGGIEQQHNQRQQQALEELGF